MKIVYTALGIAVLIVIGKLAYNALLAYEENECIAWNSGDIERMHYKRVWQGWEKEQCQRYGITLEQ